MNVGLRPRLKARPSLYDLIHQHNIDQLSVQPLRSFILELPAELPPLPLSPHKAPSAPPTPVLSTLSEPVKEFVKMAPKKEVARDEDGEEQYGRFQSMLYRGLELTIAIQARFTPSLGMEL